MPETWMCASYETINDCDDRRTSEGELRGTFCPARRRISRRDPRVREAADQGKTVVYLIAGDRVEGSLLELAGATYAKRVQNLWWATGYNVVAIPLAAGVLYGAGVLLSPAVGAALMSASTVVVAVNARLLGRRGEAAAG